MANADVLVHGTLTLLMGQAVPRSLLDHRIDKEIAPADRSFDPRALTLLVRMCVAIDVLGAFGHRQERVRHVEVRAHRGIQNRRLQLLKVLEPFAHHPQQKVDVTSGAECAVRAQDGHSLSERLQRGEQLRSSGGAYGGRRQPPGRACLVEEVADVLACRQRRLFDWPRGDAGCNDGHWSQIRS